MISNREARAAKRAAQAEKRRQEVEKRRREREDQLKREKEEFERQQQLKAELEEERKRQEEQRRLVLIVCWGTSNLISYILTCIYDLFIPGISQFSYCMFIVQLFIIIRSNFGGILFFLKDLWWCNFQDLFKCVLNKDCLYDLLGMQINRWGVPTKLSKYWHSTNVDLKHI